MTPTSLEGASNDNMEIEDRAFDIAFQLDPLPLTDADEGRSDVVVSITGTITTSLEGEPEIRRIGTLEATLILASNVMNKGRDIILECDAISGELEELAGLLYDEEGEFTKAVEDCCRAPTSGHDTLLIDLVRLDREFRGYAFGLGAVLRCIQCFGRGCGVVALRPFPLQFTRAAEERPAWRAGLQTDHFVKEQGAAEEKLRAYWGKLGFKSLGRTGYVLLNLDYDLPSWSDLGLGD
jgi:hypothetical protein